MSVIRINAITVPAAMADVFEERFAARLGEVDSMPGFERFELLRPTDGSDRYYVLTRWESAEAFDAWVASDAFTRGHATSAGPGGPAGTASELLAFDVVAESVPA